MPTKAHAEAREIAHSEPGFDQAAMALARYREDPVSFVQREFGATPDPWQVAVLRDFRHNKRLSLVACKGPGKTACLSWCILNFLVTRPYPKIVCTAITGSNLRDNLWSELSKWGKRSKLIKDQFEFSKERITLKADPANWFITARQWARDSDADAQENTLAGIHAEYVLFVIDEAGGVPDAVAATAEGGLATGTECKLVIAGNPTHLEGPLYRSATRERDLWCVHFINADPDNPNRAPQVSKEWALEMRQKWGAESAWYQVNVLGQFPKGATEGLVPLGDIEAAYGRKRSELGELLKTGKRVLGVDVARFGPDWNRVCFRNGDFLEKYDGWKGQDTLQTAGRIAAIARDYDAEEIRVDDIGVGGGVVDQLAALNLPVIPVNVGEQANDREHYFNLRAELAGKLRDAFRQGEIGLGEPIREHTLLGAEASTLRVEFTPKGQMRLEAKDTYRKRARRSPDFFDAAMLAWSDFRGPSICCAGEEVADFRGSFEPFAHTEVQNELQRIADQGTSFMRASARGKLWER